MNRSTNILGFAFLAIAVTLAASITMRNAPVPANAGDRTASRGAASEVSRRPATAPDRPSSSARSAATRTTVREPFKVSLPEEWLATLPPPQRKEWLDRTAGVEREASRQLEKLTANLDLNSTQRGKLFPALVRATAGFDPVMVVAGGAVATDPSLTPAEEIHALLDRDQQAQLEDTEVQRQLWWQDVIEKLEADLTNATGGAPLPDAPAPATPAPTDEERVAPEARDGGNLFDLIEPR